MPRGPSFTFSRRRLLQSLASIAAVSALASAAWPRDRVRVRIGFQKYGTLILLRQRGLLDERLGSLGARAEWIEFPAGPQLLEAMAAGAVDFGNTGETPPVFAQAAGVDFVYAAHEPPAPRAEAILVPQDSPILRLADLRGKRVALNKGSNVHYLLLRALASAQLRSSEIEPIYLPPADARAAFERGSVDAWAIWDPYLAAAEHGANARVLATAEGLATNRQFYLAERGFASAHPRETAAVLDSLLDLGTWAKDEPRAVAEMLSVSTGLPVEVLKTAAQRYAYGIRPLDAATVADQQRIADAFAAASLVPGRVDIAAALWDGWQQG